MLRQIQTITDPDVYVPDLAGESLFKEALAYLKMSDDGSDSGDQQSVLSQILRAVVDEIDGPSKPMGRCLFTQAWELRLDYRFPSTAIELPLPPCQSVESVQYVGVDGSLVTLDPSLYGVYGLRALEKTEIAPAYGTTWPTTRDVREAVIIRFTAGFGDRAYDLPPSILGAILETAGTRFYLRENVLPGGQYSKLPRSAQDVLEHYRVGVPLR